MRIDWWTLGLQTVNVLILVWLLSRFLFRPVRDAIAARQAAAADVLAQAKAARDTAQAEAQALAAQSAQWSAEASQRQARAREQIEAERARLLDQVHEEARTLSNQLQAAAASEQQRQRQALEAEAAELAGRMAGTLLQRLPPAPSTAALFDALVTRLAAMPARERERLAQDQPLQLAVAALPDAPTRGRWMTELSRWLPEPLPELVEEPALLAGVELRGPHARLSSHWRADLDAMQSALKRDVTASGSTSTSAPETSAKEAGNV